MHEHSPRTTAGFSLVELLVAMVIGLMLTTGTIAVFSGNQRSSQINDAMADMQESARFALDRMAEDIRMSGYQGCAHIEGAALGGAGNPIRADNPPTTNLANTATTGSVIGSNDNWQPGPPIGFSRSNAGAAPGTHALSLQFGGPGAGVLVADQNDVNGNPNASAPLIVSTFDGLPLPASEGDLMIVSDCSRAELFRVTGPTATATRTTLGHDASLNSQGSFDQPFSANAETQVLSFSSNVYYVADTGRTNRDGDAIRALFRQSLPFGNPVTNPPTELVQGVENLRLAFGISNGGNLRYVAPGAAGYNPADVVAVRVGLLMNSWERVAQQDDVNTYLLAGQPIVPAGANGGDDTHAGDRRMRLAFNTTVKVRNRR